jgi:hypothetical protein
VTHTYNPPSDASIKREGRNVTTRAIATLELKSWDEQPFEEMEGGSKFTRASVTQSVAGDISGEATSESLMYYRQDGTANYTGLQRFVGQIGDHSGSFVVQATGIYDGNEAKTDVLVIPGSGTDDLMGLRGEGTFVAPHGPTGTLTLDYDID